MTTDDAIAKTAREAFLVILRKKLKISEVELAILNCDAECSRLGKEDDDLYDKYYELKYGLKGKWMNPDGEKRHHEIETKQHKIAEEKSKLIKERVLLEEELENILNKYK